MSDDARPYPKAQQLARGERRYRRKVASSKRWQAIIDAKVGPCRVCCDPGRNGSQWGRIQMHHLIPRGAPYFGEDVPENIVPLCFDCHRLVTARDAVAREVLAAMLTDAEYAYVIGKLGEGALARLYGV